jgi:hypothetical protein
MSYSQLTQTQKEMLLIVGRLHQFVVIYELDKKANINLEADEHLGLLDPTTHKNIDPHLSKKAKRHLQNLIADTLQNIKNHYSRVQEKDEPITSIVRTTT